MTKKKNPEKPISEQTLEMKQVFRKDPPVVFDTDTVIRVCNASNRELLKSLMREPARAGAMRAYGLGRVGPGC